MNADGRARWNLKRAASYGNTFMPSEVNFIYLQWAAWKDAGWYWFLKYEHTRRQSKGEAETKTS